MEAPDVAAEMDAAPVQRTACPRLLSVEAAARYLSISEWSIRDYVAAGLLPAVRLPAPRHREPEPRSIRRVLVDVRDLDQLIERSKGGPADG